MKKIKLLIVTPYFYPKIGGMEKHVFTICKGLMKNYNYEIVVITSNHESKRYKEEVLEGMKIYRLPYQFKVSNTPISFKWKRQIREIIGKEQPDIINGRGPVPFISDISCSIAKKMDIPFVLGWHAQSMKKGNLILDLIIYIYESIFLEKMLKDSIKLICSSKYVKDTLFKKYFKKATIITQGIDNSLFKRLDIKKEKHSIIFVGNFETKIKGLKYILNAIVILKKYFSDIKLNIVGSGKIKDYKQKCKNLGIEKNVFFKGELCGKKLVMEYNRNEIFVCPSINENFPSTLIEAMFCELPTISTNVGNIPYIIKDNITGLLVQPRNSQEIARKIRELFNDKKLAKKIANGGKKYVIGKFDWQGRISKTNKLFKEILK